MKTTVVQVTYKYGTERERKELSFDSLEEANEYIFECVEEEPQQDDFDFHEEYEYALFRWRQNQYLGSSKWFEEYYIDGELIAGHAGDY